MHSTHGLGRAARLGIPPSILLRSESLCLMKKPVGTVATFGVALALLVLVANAVISYMNTRKLVDDEGWVEHTQVVRGEIEYLQANISDAVAAERGFLLVNDSRFLDPYQSAQAATHERVLRLRQLTADNLSQQARIASLEQFIAAEFQGLEAGIAARRAGSVDFALHPEIIEQGKGSMDLIRAKLNEMRDEESRLLSAARSVDQGQLPLGARNIWHCVGGGDHAGGALLSFDPPRGSAAGGGGAASRIVWRTTTSCSLNRPATEFTASICGATARFSTSREREFSA